MDYQIVNSDTAALQRQIDTLKTEIQSLRREQCPADRGRGYLLRFSRRRVVAAIIVLSSVLASATVLSQVTTDCATGLFCFTPNAPAKASEVNSNFAIVKNWLEQKVGVVGNGNVTASGNVSAGGEVSATAMSATSDVTVGGGVSANTMSTTSDATVGGNLTVTGDVLATQDTGQLAPSTDFAFRDTGDTWLRLNNGAGSDTYADLAAGQLYGETAILFRGAAVVSNVTACCQGSAGNCCPAGFSHVNVDLNRGAGGDYCYLCVAYAR